MKIDIKKQSFFQVYQDEMRARPTEFTKKCTPWLGVAFDGFDLSIKPPCPMCRCAYPIGYPQRALTILTEDKATASELNSLVARLCGKCVEALLFVMGVRLQKSPLLH